MHSIEILTKRLDVYGSSESSGEGKQNKPTISCKPRTHATKVVDFVSQRQKHDQVTSASSEPTEKTPQNKPYTPHSQNKRLQSASTNFSTKSKRAHENIQNPLVSETIETEAENENIETIPLLAKCISFVMKRGQKAKAASTMNRVLRMLQKLLPQNKKLVQTLDIIQVAINNVKPAFELRKARFGGKTQFIPATLPVHKQENQALRALLQTARIKHKKISHTNKHHDMYTFAYFFAQEIYDAYKYQGAACQAKHTTHKQAEHNRSHVRRRWW